MVYDPSKLKMLHDFGDDSMSDYDNTNKGVLFRNDNKTDSRQPDHKGSINIEGKEFWVSAWVKEAGPAAKNPGQKFFSLAVTPKDSNSGSNSRNNASRPVSDDFDDDIPF